MIKIDDRKNTLYRAYPYLPGHIVTTLGLFCLKEPDMAENVTEIRLRLGAALSVSVSDKNVTFDPEGNVSGRPYICTKSDIDTCAGLLSGNSFHSHEKELENGYISTAGGLRAGVSTYGTYGGAVWGIDGICIRIPHSVPGCSARLFELTGLCSMLICSPPGVGKTTLLRDAAERLCSVYGLRIAVCDEKYELLPEKKPLFADYICGKSKAEAIACAVRYMSAQAIICDELGGEDEAKQIMSAQSGGVIFIATAHADSMGSALSRPSLRMLYDGGVFDKYVFLRRENGKFGFDTVDAK